MNILETGYKYIFKPVVFHFDPEFIHDRVVAFGVILGKYKITRNLVQGLLAYRHKSLEQTILGIKFNNPIGLAAGFDKNAELTEILASVGFGFAELGSITGEPCAGNLGKRLWRLPKSKSLLVNYGLKNDGAEKISTRLRGKNFSLPIGISVAKTNSPDAVTMEAGIADYVKAYREFADIGAYKTINISCPNAFGGQPFTDPQSLDALLGAIDGAGGSGPVFVKLSPDLGLSLVDQLLEVIGRHRVSGIICSNLTKNRDNKEIKDNNLPDVGGMSGKVVDGLANELISHVYKKTAGRYVIVGCGGVFSAEDAYKKIRLGASLIQLITGMVYSGPQLIGQINRGLVALLKRDGFTNISQAIGIDSK
jgi:dihydroorotate dehydrogenase